MTGPGRSLFAFASLEFPPPIPMFLAGPKIP